MLKEERYEKILEIIDEENYTSAQALSKRLFVSLPTVRRDLAELQKRSLILRSHGGAKKINTEHIVMPLDFRKTISHAEKRRICSAAARLIKDDDIVFIDASTTALQLVDFLSDKKSITVVTNSIPLSAALHKKHIKTYCTGGEMLNHSLGYAGSYAEEFIRNFNIDIAFFSCCGINDAGMIVDASLSETMLRKEAVRCSSTTVFLCDHSKFHLRAPYNVMPINDADFVITDDATDEEARRLVDAERLIVC